MTWARILLLVEAFASGLPRSDFETKAFFAGGNLFLVLRDLGSDPAAV